MLKNNHNQNGFVSILVVIFFMLLASILTIGFVKLVNFNQKQALADQESKFAYQSAQAGVEDAKRAILYCQEHSMANPPCSDLYKQSCPGFFAGNNFASLGVIQRPDSAVQVGDVSLNQRYTCVTISNVIDSVITNLFPHTSRDSDFFPIKSAGQYNQVRIAWGSKAYGQASSVPVQTVVNNTNLRDSTNGTAPSRWQDNWPAMLAITNIQHKESGGFTVGDIASRHFFLVPSQSGATAIQAESGAARQLAECDTSGPYGIHGGYVCQATLTYNQLTDRSRYLALTAYYNPTEVEISLFNSTTNQPVQLKDVRLDVDSTGAVSDVYRRVGVQVDASAASLGGVSSALDLGGGLCKNFLVTYTSSEFKDLCP